MTKTISTLVVMTTLAISAGFQTSVPAIFWLIGAGFLGLIGFSSRKTI